MRKSCILHAGLGWLFGILIVAQPLVADQLEIVADGTSEYVIAISESAEQARIKEAARFLQASILEATAVELPVVRESEVEPGRPGIYLGWSDAARQAGIEVEEVTGWSYRNKVIDGNVFLVGEDRESILGEGARRGAIGAYGSFKAVTAFLDSQLGVRFLMPGAFGTHIPESDRFTVAADMDDQWSPTIAYMVGRGAQLVHPNRPLHDKAYAFANHIFGQSELFAHYGGHSYYYAVPEEKYGESNPEYFAKIGGLRTLKGNHLCISNSEVQEIMLAELERQYELGYEWVALGQTDGYVPCECADCRALHDDIGERIWIVHRKLAEEINRRVPGKKVVMLSYRDTNDPPVSFDSFPENVIIELTRYRPEDFQIWRESGFGEVPKTLYTTNWLSVHPRISPFTAVNQVRLFSDNDVRGIYLCGGFNMRAGGNWYPWGLGGPGYYAFTRALHDPNVNPVALRSEYVNAVFGEAASPMQTFFQRLDSRMDSFWLLYRRDSRNGPPTGMMQSGDFEAHFYPPEVLVEMQSSLERAWEMATDEKVKAHLRLVELEFAYLQSLAKVHHLYRAYMAAPSWEALDLLEAQVAQFRETIDKVWPEGNRTEIPGVPSPFAGSDRRGASGAPFNWNFESLREEGTLPGDRGVMATAVVSRVEPFEIDGNLDKPVWETIPAEALSEMELGAVPRASFMKLAYDDEHLYLAFQGEINSPTALDHVVPVGRDGVTWRQEGIEVAIDPVGSRSMYYHFAVNPVPDSSLERRFGYHTDPDHPLYQDFEWWEWRVDWDYAVHVDEEAQYWTAELKIPFASMEVETPGSGDLWTLNLVRAEYPEGGNRIYYLWSPNPLTRNFHDPSAFGEITFE